VQRTWTPTSRWHVGGLAWNRCQAIEPESEQPIRIWEDDGEVVAFGWRQRHGDLAPCLDPARPELWSGVLDWYERSAPGTELRVTMTGEEPRLGQRGYALASPDEPFFLHLARDLADVEEPTLPPGYRLRGLAGPPELDARVAVHRAAFDPSRLTADTYRTVMAAWPYRPDLDRVVEAPDGSLAAFCLAWIDEANRVGELEPVGTHPDHRRLGLGRAVCLDASLRLREAGADLALVAARGDDAYPVPRRLYAAVGFREVARNVTYVRSRSG